MKTPAAPALEDLLVHGAWLKQLASTLVATDSDADDLVQETWLAALVRGPAGGSRDGEVRGWLARVLRNKASSRARAAGARHQREQHTARTESLPSTAVLAGRADMSRKLVELVLELPSDQQRILLARYFEGLSSAEIARRLGRPTSSVRSQLKRGLDQLRDRLDAESDGERQRWLSALTPLVALPERSLLGLGTVLATSAGLKSAAALGLAVLAAGVWWMSRAPGPVTPTAEPVVADRSVTEPDEAGPQVDLPANELAVTPEAGRVALAGAAPKAVGIIEGRVVHPDTGEPVVWFELGIIRAELADPFFTKVDRGTQIPDPEGLELVRTDESGRFASRVQHSRGDYVLVPIEEWRLAQPRMEPFRVRQPRAPMRFEHDPEEPVPHEYELETGTVFAIDCPEALELGAESMVAIYSYLDHFPPGYFRPSHLQTVPVPFVRMHTDIAPSHRNQVNNLRLVSTDGLWSGSIPMELPESIATQYVSFNLEARALIEVGLDFGERHPPPFLELHYWKGSVDPTAEGAPEPDIREIQAKFDGTLLEEAIVMYVPTGLGTVAIESTSSDTWHRVLNIVPGRNRLEATLVPDAAATGRIAGRVVHVDPGEPEPIVSAIVSGDVDGKPSFHVMDLEFQQRGGLWVADFEFTHLALTEYTLWFEKGGPTNHDPKTFSVEPQMIQVEARDDLTGDPLEFELHTDLTRTRFRVSARDAVTGEKVKEFAVSVFVPGAWLSSRNKSAKTGRATMNLLGDLEHGMASIAAKGYIRRDVALSEAEHTGKGLELELELTPGWGGPVHATHADTYGPLAGVRVLLDGIEYGVTDEAGRLQVELPAPPERVDFELDGFEVAGQAGWVNNEGEVIELGPDPISQYIGVSLRERP